MCSQYMHLCDWVKWSRREVRYHLTGPYIRSAPSVVIALKVIRNCNFQIHYVYSKLGKGGRTRNCTLCVWEFVGVCCCVRMFTYMSACLYTHTCSKHTRTRTRTLSPNFSEFSRVQRVLSLYKWCESQSRNRWEFFFPDVAFFWISYN
jgi:hypothetical protein